MANPTENVPADGPLRQSDGEFEFGALGVGVTGAGGVGAMVELTDQLHRTIQGMDTAIPMIADVHHPSAERAVPVEDFEFPEGEIRLFRPGVRHSADLQVVVGNRSARHTAQELTPEIPAFLALLRTVEFKHWLVEQRRLRPSSVNRKL